MKATKPGKLLLKQARDRRHTRALVRSLPPGWRIVGKTSNGHIWLAKPGCRRIVTSSAGGDFRVLKHLRKDIERAEREGQG